MPENHGRMNGARETGLPSPVFNRFPVVLAVASCAAVLIWTFWPTLRVMSEQWSNDPRYSHGYLVPAFSLFLLWSRRAMMRTGDTRPRLLGFAVLLAGLAIRAVGIVFFVPWLTAAPIVPCLFGLALLAGGRSAFKWTWPASAFLIFMVPLPYQAEIALAHPLQRIATLVSTYALQTVGLIAVAEGNTIRMNGGIRLGVVEACSGLSMLMNFFALSTAAAVVIKRPMYERIMLVLAAVPIALIANIIRITVTGILHKTVGSELADRVFHDFAGWLMMPIALGLLWIVLWVMSRLVVDAKPVSREKANGRPLPDFLRGANIG